MKIEEPGKPKIGISSCLLGKKVRFDGGHKHEPFLTKTVGDFVDWVPVCPEMEVGMGVPRESVRLVGDPAQPRMMAERSGKDWTDEMLDYSRKRIEIIRRLSLSGYILKKDSPTCGMERVRVYRGTGVPAKDGRGLYAQVLMQEMPLLPVEEEGRLNDPVLRDNFYVRVFAYRRWQQYMGAHPRLGGLVDFHARHKLLLLAHSEPHMRRLGKLVASAKSRPLDDVVLEYGRFFMEGLGKHATVKTHVNVLQHVLGYFSEKLEAPERVELLGVIEDYRKRLTPLIVPLTLVRHYVAKFDVPYIREQVYLQPHPKELMLRNHV